MVRVPDVWRRVLRFTPGCVVLTIAVLAVVSANRLTAADNPEKTQIVPDDVWPDAEQPQLKDDPSFNAPDRVEQRFRHVADRQNRDSRASSSALTDAVLKNDRALARLLLRRGAAVELSDQESELGFSPLGAAIVNNDTGAVEFLLKAGATPDFDSLTFMTDKTPPKTQVEITRLFLKAGLDPVSEPGLVQRFARMAAPEAFALLFQHGARVHDLPAAEPIGESDSTLISAIASTEKVRICLEQGADPNQLVSWNKESPLHAAAANGNAATIDLLIKHGARLNARDRQGRTPLDAAVQQGFVSPECIGDFVDPGTVEALLRHGAKGSIATDVATGNLKALKARKREGLPIEAKAQDENGTEVAIDLVELATAFRQADTLQWLLGSGIRESKNVRVLPGSEDMPTRKDMPAIVMAAHHRDVKCVEILLKHGADPNATTSNDVYLTRSWAPLHAVLHPVSPYSTGEFEMRSPPDELTGEQLTIIKLLINNGADVMLEDGTGQLPVELLSEKAAKRYGSLFQRTSK